ncbi:MAG: hypothetical protein R3B99_16485 [Polyangiales bacterium]
MTLETLHSRPCSTSTPSDLTGKVAAITDDERMAMARAREPGRLGARVLLLNRESAPRARSLG